MRTSFSRLRQTGFSLIELLIVCGIIAVVVGFTVPAATTLIRGTQMTQGSQLLTDHVSLARQIALTKNRAVEFRFYKFADPETPGEDKAKPSTGRFRAFQAFEVLESGAFIPVDKVQRLPSTVIINESTELSSLIGASGVLSALTEKGQDASLPELPRDVGLNYEFVRFRFQPDGSTNLSLSLKGAAAGKWFVTLHSIDYDPIKTTEPKDGASRQINFFTLQVDPVSGATKSYRPTAG
ncbi:MAG: Verru_Chthon cassette protein D [Verrucomicrobiota bacterium]